MKYSTQPGIILRYDSSKFEYAPARGKNGFPPRGAFGRMFIMAEDSVHPEAPTVPRAEATEPAPPGLSDPREWVARHGDYLYRYALIRVRDGTTAEDLVQDTLLAALQSKDRFASEFPERSWLTGILRHKIYDHFRRLNRERTVFQNESLPEELEGRFDDLGHWRQGPPLGPADWGPDAAALMQRKEFMLALKQCLAKLPPRCADAFVLREMEAVESEKVQEILGITAANFWVLLHRARMQLRLCLEKSWLGA
ncbi:MAG: sigma-70 family RNA polymerase sigma factor [Verrucomicrobia bacterium]|nr:sigma-70 family RNA polymerase sigma factor [Verrucomicrobiota bacterium]